MRIVTLWNDDWKFAKGDPPGAEAAGFDDAAWRSLTLPHDWSIEGPFDPDWASATGFLPGGIGWYRKSFTLPPEFTERRVAVHFDGVYCRSEMWVNGHPLGQRPSGFVSFAYDLTPYLQADGTNTLAVRVDHSQFADARWYTGSGINRSVSLLATDPVHVGLWGVFVTTPAVAADRAEVQVSVTVSNDGETAADVQIAHTLLDAGGQAVGEAAGRDAVPAGQVGVTQSRIDVWHPKLWSPDAPALYTLQTILRRDGAEIDRVETTVGIRAFAFDPDDGFTLNDVPMKIKGVCLHDDAGALGTAVLPKVWERRLRTLKAGGVNAIRMAHNPHMPELYDLCDRLGFLVQDEAFDEWEIGKNKWIAGWNVGAPGQDGPHAFFDDWAEADLRDMVRRDRNHPSVIMWSIGNEIDYPNDPYSHEVLDAEDNPQSHGRGFDPSRPHASRLGGIARRLAAVVRAWDTTRPVTAALAAAPVANETGFADALDVVGLNYQEGRYAEEHARHPGRVLYGSENGMSGDAWRAVADNPYISGQFLWTGIDYLGEARQWPSRSNGSGLLDLAGFAKPEYFYRQSLWSAEPMAYLGTRDVPQADEVSSLWSHQQVAPVWRGTPGRPVRVVCFTNCPEAELFVNGRSLGVGRRDDAPDHVLSWDVPYEPGNVIVRGLRDGQTVAGAGLKTGGPPHALRAVTDTETLAADGIDLAHVSVSVIDADGVSVYDADHEVTWAITGPARLLGLESGDLASHEDYRAAARRVFHGRLLGYVQATRTPGPITIRLSAPGLEAATLELRSD